MSKEKETKKSSSKKSSKSEKHSSKHSGAKIAEAMKAVLKLAMAKPKHYTARYLSSEGKLGGKFGAEVVRGAIASLEETEKISFSRKEGGKGKKGQFVIVPLTRKAA